MPTVASVLAKHLAQWGVNHVFGVPGKPVVPLIVELESKGIQFVLSRHECGAGYEATGYALQKDGLGVAIGTSGPGGTNLLTAAAQAKAYHQPVLFITGQPPYHHVGKSQGQDSSIFGTDLVEMFKPVTRFSARVERGENFYLYLLHALEKALTGIKGPVHLSIPLDVLLEEIQDFDLSLPTVKPYYVSSLLDEAIELLNESHKPVLLLGKGVHTSKAYEEVQHFVEKWKIPVITTPGGKGSFPTEHPWSLGSFGLGGTDEAEEYLKSGIDLLVVVGTSLSDMSLAGFTESMYPKQVIHFDYDLTFVGKSIPVPTLPIQGDAKTNLQELLSIPLTNIEINREPVRSTASSDSAETYKHTKEGLEGGSNTERISAEQTIKLLRNLLPEETILFGDDGSHTFYAIKHFNIVQPGTFFFDDVFGAMGHAIGFSIGAKLASPEQPIICLTGDGCLFMHGTEISTAVNHHANVIFIVLNNGMLDMVDKGMSQNLGRSVGTRYEMEINAKLFAESLGAKGYRCQTVTEIEQAVQMALSDEVPSVIEILVDKNEIPPTLKRG